MTTRPLAGLLITVTMVDYQIAEKKNTESSFNMQRQQRDKPHRRHVQKKKMGHVRGHAGGTNSFGLHVQFQFQVKRKKSNRFHLTHTHGALSLVAGCSTSYFIKLLPSAVVAGRV